eukprot:jgi/Botrbrau1/11862/Bobra.0175s0022.3
MIFDLLLKGQRHFYDTREQVPSKWLPVVPWLVSWVILNEKPMFNLGSYPSCSPLKYMWVCKVQDNSSSSNFSLSGTSDNSRITSGIGEEGEQQRLMKILSIAIENKTTASAPAFSRAVSAGDTTRLKLAFKKLLAGQHLKVVVLGASISAGMGVSELRNSYASLLSNWFHSFKSIGGDVEFINSAVRGTTSSYASLCVDDFVPTDADIVILEYALNDWDVVREKASWMDNYQRRAYERLIRKILSRPNSPAILLAHWWAPRHFAYSFWNVAEDQCTIVGKYYGLSAISFRDAYYDKIMTSAIGFNMSDFMCDVVHPNALGHRYFADLIIAHLQQSLAEAVLTPSDTDESNMGLPPPMFRGNDFTSTGKCVRGDDFKNAVVDAQGFEWKNQAKEGEPQAKWAYEGTTPGSRLVIQIGIPESRAQGAPFRTVVSLGVLKSYKGMGVAEITCRSPTENHEACSCNWSIDAHHPQHNSQVYWLSGMVTTGPNCLLQVEISNVTSSGAHKVVIFSLLVMDEATDNLHIFSSWPNRFETGW